MLLKMGMRASSSFFPFFQEHNQTHLDGKDDILIIALWLGIRLLSVQIFQWPLIHIVSKLDRSDSLAA